MTEIKLVVSDLDGTLLDERKTLTQEAIESVERLRQAGIKFTFATGRVDRMTWHYARALNLSLPTITCNGALIKEAFGGRTHESELLDDDMTSDFVAFALEHKLDLLVYTDYEVYQLPWSTRIEVFRHYNEMANQSGVEPVPIEVQDALPQAGTAWHHRAVKLFIQFPEYQRDMIRAKLASYDNIQVVQSDAGSLDINNKGCSKGRAVTKLANELGIDMAQVCCLGDQNNDIDMIQLAGVGIAMGNAEPSVKSFAQFVAPTHRENGFAKAIQKYVLEK